MAKNPLTAKEHAFVDCYLGSANGNGREAARRAGYKQSENALAVTASRLLKKANVAAAIKARQERKTTKAILDADARDQLLSDIASNKNNEVRDRIRAIGELNKCSGRHSVKHMHEGTLTLEQILADSRK